MRHKLSVRELVLIFPDQGIAGRARDWAPHHVVGVSELGGEAPEAALIEPSDPAYLLFTSGSTGIPNEGPNEEVTARLGPADQEAVRRIPSILTEHLGSPDAARTITDTTGRPQVRRGRPLTAPKVDRISM